MHKPSPEVQNKQTSTTLGKRLWLGTCVRYTVLALLTLLFSALLSDSVTATYVDTLRFFLLFPFGFCLTVATLVRQAESWSTALRCALHPLLVLGGGYLCFYLPYQARTKPSGSQALMMVLLGVVLYATVMGIILLITRKQRREKQEQIPYVSQYRQK